MRIRSLGMAALLVLLVLASLTPAFAAPPDGTMVIGLHVTLVSRWLDPGETEALITPFMVLYALHDALVKPMPAGIMHPEPGRVVDDLQGRAHLRVPDPEERQVPQRRSGHGGGREVHLRALQGRLGPAPQGQGQGGPDRRAEPRALRPEGSRGPTSWRSTAPRPPGPAGSSPRSTSRRSARTASRRRRWAPVRTSSCPSIPAWSW